MAALRILLVEDSENDAELILLALAAAGLNANGRRVETETQMRAALGEGGWDLTISDYNLPSFSAAAALAMMQAFDPDIPFIVVSGYIGEEAAVAILKAGAHDFVAKDNLARLAPAIERELREAENRRAHFRATEELIESRRQSRALASHLQTVREEERARIARELHDELGQMLTALKIDVTWLRNRCPACATTDVAPKLADMSGLIDATIAAARRISADLRPTMLDDLGLKAAVEWLLEEFGKRNPEIRCALSLELGEHDIDDRLATAAFRIVQECLTNVARHAQAGAVRVYAGVCLDRLAISVADNGQGLPSAPVRKDSYGLIGMRERAQALGGALTLRGEPAGGLIVEAILPLHVPEDSP
jgi:signal transduction histidine kinase